MSIDQIAPLVLAIVSYTAGLLTGLFVRSAFKMQKEDNGGFVLMVVTIIWALSVIVDILSPQYETSPLIHGLMGAIVGFFYRPKMGGTNEKN